MTITKDGWVKGAKQRPLGPQNEPRIDPRVLIYHIIVGSADAGYAVFKPDGYIGEESTFIVCGPRDVAAGHEDGELWQLQDIFHQADAQYAGNDIGNSVETSGMPNEPFSSAMLRTLIHLTVVWCENRKAPAKLVAKTGPVGKGLGYHELRADWNLARHSCPGAVREGQLRQIVIPKARARLEKRAEPKAPKPRLDGKCEVDGIFGIDTIAALQTALKRHKFYDRPSDKVDGIFGPRTRLELKRYLRRLGFRVGTENPDIGAAAVEALQIHINAKQDGIWGRGCTRRLQHALKERRF